MNDLFLSDWLDQQTIENVWPSDVISSFQTDAEDRRSLSTKPRRLIVANWKGMDRNLSSRMLFQLMRSADQSVEIPIYSDQAEVTNVTGAVITCDTLARRFNVGFKVVIVSEDRQTVERGTIQSLTANDITLTAALTGTYNLGSLVFPVIDAQPVLNHRALYRTDELVDAEATFKEVAGNTALPSLVPTFGDNPVGFSLFQSLPVLDYKHNWRAEMSLKVGRTGSQITQGKADTVEVAGQRPILSFALEFSPLDRTEAFTFLEFFDSRRGRCLPFWIIAPHSQFRATSAAGPNINIEALENTADITDFVQWIAIEEKDGTLHLAELSGFAVLSPTEWRLDPVVGFPAIPLADIERVTTAHLVRFSEDNLVESWRSDGAAVMRTSVTELVNEQTIEVTDL